MNKALIAIASALLVATAVLVATLRAEPADLNGQAKSTTAPAAATVRGTVRSIQLPQLEPDLPAGPHRDEVIAYCGMCHTAHYIMIQPPFPRQTWLAEVTKMRTAFSGPIPEEKVPQIVDYLTAVRGAPDPKAH